jgi:hypothetical protein
VLYDFRLQYDPGLIPELAEKYLRTPYKGGTTADADRRMEEAGRRFANGPFKSRRCWGDCRVEVSPQDGQIQTE